MNIFYINFLNVWLCLESNLREVIQSLVCKKLFQMLGFSFQYFNGITSVTQNRTSDSLVDSLVFSSV